MREWLRNHPDTIGFLLLALAIVVVLAGIWGLGVPASSNTDSTPWTAPTRRLIEVYEQHPAGLDEVWYVVRWWDEGAMHEDMVHSGEARDRLVEEIGRRVQR